MLRTDCFCCGFKHIIHHEERQPPARIIQLLIEMSQPNMVLGLIRVTCHLSLYISHTSQLAGDRQVAGVIQDTRNRRQRTGVTNVKVVMIPGNHQGLSWCTWEHTQTSLMIPEFIQIKPSLELRLSTFCVRRR